VLQYTGGTTGVAKGATLLHRTLVANLLASEAWMQPGLKRKKLEGQQSQAPGVPAPATAPAPAPAQKK